MAQAADAHGHGTGKGIRFGKYRAARRPEIDYADSRMKFVVLHRLRSGRELADRDVDLPVNDAAFRRPAAPPDAGILVEQETYASGEPEHRQHAKGCQPFAQRQVRQTLLMHRGRVDCRQEAAHDMGCHRRDARGRVHCGAPEHRLADLLNLSPVACDPCLHRWSMPGPLADRPELPVHVVAGVRQGEALEGPAQDLLIDNPPRDLHARHIDVRSRRWIRGDQTRSLKVIVVVAPSPAQRKGRCHSQPATPRPTHALLIVEAHRRHVGESDALERSNVNSGLHRCRHAEEIDAERYIDLVLHEDLLEAALPQPSVGSVRLPRQFLAVQSERRLRTSGEELVEVLGRIEHRVLRGGGKPRSAACADASRRVQMRAAASRALTHVNVACRIRTRTHDVHAVHDYPPVALVQCRSEKGDDSLLETLRVRARSRGDLR